MSPYVSIIIPAYNVENLIGNCIDSIVGQDYINWELIIVDDGSTDDTFAHCIKKAKQYSNIKVIHTDNHGAFEARLIGVSQANGSWIMFVDSDDTLNKDAISGLIKYASYGADIIAGTLNINNQRIFQHDVKGLISNKEYTKALLNYKTSIGPVAKLFKKTLFDNQLTIPRIRIRVNEDLLLLLSLTSFANSVYIANEVVCYNYHFRCNTMRTFAMSICDWSYLFDIISAIIKVYDDRSIDRAFFSMRLNRIYYAMILKGNFLKSDDQLYSEILNSYSNFRNMCDPSENRIIKIITSPLKQRINFYSFKIKHHLIYLIKKLLNH